MGQENKMLIPGKEKVLYNDTWTEVRKGGIVQINTCETRKLFLPNEQIIKEMAYI